MSWLRLLGAAVLAEAIPIVLLVAVVAVFGPSTADAAAAFATRVGAVLGPIAGMVCTFVAAIWLSRSIAVSPLRRGALFGVLVARIDIALLLASEATFAWVFVASNVGRVLAGSAGGWVVARQRRRQPAT